MRFMIIRMADKDTEAGVMPGEPLLAAMGQYMEEMGRAGILLAGEGLHPTSDGVRVRFSDGEPEVKKGPFRNTRDTVAGWTLIQVGSLDQAVEWAERWPALDGGGNVELEIRQVYEADEFGPEFTPELREAEDRLRRTLSSRS